MVVKSVPAEATVVGVPGRIFRAVEHHLEPDLEHGKLPDPLTSELRTVVRAERALEERRRRFEEFFAASRAALERESSAINQAAADADIGVPAKPSVRRGSSA